MKHLTIGLALALLAAGAPVRAQEGDFCTTLKAAWTAGKNDPKSLGEYRIAGANLCHVATDGDLMCSWVLGSKDQGRSTYETFKTSAIACLAPVGLKPTFKTIDGVETTSLETPSDAPDVAIFYPGGVTVTVSVITAQ